MFTRFHFAGQTDYLFSVCSFFNFCRRIYIYELEKWENMWLVEFNADKCHVLRVSRKRNPLNHKYILHGEILESVDSCKVSRSKNTIESVHISNIITKGNQTLGFLRRNLRLINSPELKSVANKSLVQPTVEYASSV